MLLLNIHSKWFRCFHNDVSLSLFSKCKGNLTKAVNCKSMMNVRNGKHSLLVSNYSSFVFTQQERYVTHLYPLSWSHRKCSQGLSRYYFYWTEPMNPADKCKKVLKNTTHVADQKKNNSKSRCSGPCSLFPIATVSCLLISCFSRMMMQSKSEMFLSDLRKRKEKNCQPFKICFNPSNYRTWAALMFSCLWLCLTATFMFHASSPWILLLQKVLPAVWPLLKDPQGNPRCLPHPWWW